MNGGLLVLGYLLLQSAKVHLVKGRCYRWTYRYSPRLTDVEWAKVVAFHKQYTDPNPDSVRATRSTQTVVFDLQSWDDRTIDRETRDKPATYLAHVRAGITVTSRVDDCDVPNV